MNPEPGNYVMLVVWGRLCAVRVRQRSETRDRQRVLLVVQDTTAAAKVDQGFPASEQRDEWVGAGKVASDGWANGVDEGLCGSWLRERRGSKQAT